MIALITAIQRILGSIVISCSILSIILSLYSIIDKDEEKSKEIFKMSLIVWLFALVSILVLFGLVYIK